MPYRRGTLNLGDSHAMTAGKFKYKMTPRQQPSSVKPGRLSRPSQGAEGRALSGPAGRGCQWEAEAPRCSMVGERAHGGAGAATGTWPSPSVTVPHWQALMAALKAAAAASSRTVIAEAGHRAISGRPGR